MRNGPRATLLAISAVPGPAAAAEAQGFGGSLDKDAAAKRQAREAGR